MNERIKELIVNLEPDAFMTYKGYLYHSGDPKVLEHSDPEPLYTRQELLKLIGLTVREYASEYNKLINGEAVVLPKDREHAEALVRVGMFYLENNK